jgi:hypothetical protein
VGAMKRYVVDYEDATVRLEHLDGVDWIDAPIPWRWHGCWAQTRGRLHGIPIDRCACGAVRHRGGPWLERNSRRKNQ